MTEALAPWEGEPPAGWSAPATGPIDAGAWGAELKALSRRRIGPGPIDEPTHLPFMVGGPTAVEKRKKTLKKKRDKARRNAGNHVLLFGRHKGKTIRQIDREDEQYLRWIAGAKDFSMPTVQKIVRTYLGRLC